MTGFMRRYNGTLFYVVHMYTTSHELFIFEAAIKISVKEQMM